MFYNLFFTHRGSEPAQGMPERCVLLDGCSKAFVGLPVGTDGDLMGKSWGYNSSNKDLPSGYLLHRHGIDGPNRNRWFTELKNGGSFHGEL